MIICDSELCTGCLACGSVCSQKAISETQDEQGFVIPLIDETKCIKCNICIKTCPQNTPVLKQASDNCWAAISLNRQIHEDSTSGGIISTISDYALKNGWCVYLHRFEKDELVCRAINNMDDIQKCQGSKYVESHMHLVINEIQSKLKNNKKVLFVGTPCQVAGVINACKRHDSNLLTISFICGGVPSQKYLNETLSGIRNYKDIRFRRNNEYGFWLNDGIKERTIKRINSPYFIAFDEHISLRESCYKCLYCTVERVGDITVGDFWGLRKTKFELERSKGISVIITTTEKGKEIINIMSEKKLIDIECHQIDEAWQENPRLKTNVERNSHKDEFKQMVIQHGFDKAVWKIYKRKYRVVKLKTVLKKIKILDALYHMRQAR